MSRERDHSKIMTGWRGLVQWFHTLSGKEKSSHSGNNKLTVETASIFIMLWQEDLNCGNANYAFLLRLHIGTFFVVLIRKLIADLSCYHGDFNIFFPLSLKRKNACLSISLASSEIIRKIKVRAQRGLGPSDLSPSIHRWGNQGLRDSSILEVKCLPFNIYFKVIY